MALSSTVIIKLYSNCSPNESVNTKMTDNMPRSASEYVC